MAAPAGNQFWKMRSKHGRDVLFETPEALWEACTEYFEWVDENPWEKVDAVKGGEAAGMLIRIPTARPYTIQGLCRYLDCNEVWFNHFESSLKGKQDERSQGFSKIITRVREVIYQQKFEGAAVGAFNPSIIARDLGLKEKTESDVNMNAVLKVNYENLTDEELMKLAELQTKVSGGSE